MKNTEIHQKFEKSEIRDFLSKSICDYYKKLSELNNEKLNKEYSNLKGFEYTIRRCEDEIEYQQKLLTNTKNVNAVAILIENLGWNEFDVSDETEKNSNMEMAMNFIGTEDEYRLLLNVIKEENKVPINFVTF